jgi:beta-galactosidase
MPAFSISGGSMTFHTAITTAAAFAIALTATASAAPRENIARSKVCKASSVEGKLTPDKAVDGPKSQGSRWGSNYGTDKNKDSAWIFVDLGKSWNVDSVAIYWEHSGAKLYTLQTWTSPTDTPSYDDKGWTTVFTDTTLKYQLPPVDMCLSFIKLAPVSTRFLRVRCYKRMFEFGFSIMELEVYGTDGPTALRSARAGQRKPAIRIPFSGLTDFADRTGKEFSLTGRILPERFLP